MDLHTETETKQPRGTRRLKQLSPETAEAIEEQAQLETERALQEFGDPEVATLKKPSRLSDATWAEVSSRMKKNGPDFDIFKDYGTLILAEGVSVEYTIYRTGKQVATVEGEYSWDAIHRQYGEGSYRVVLRIVGEGIILKHQNKTLGERTQGTRAPETAQTVTQGIPFDQFQSMLREERQAWEKTKESTPPTAKIDWMALLTVAAPIVMGIVEKISSQNAETAKAIAQIASQSQKPQDSGMVTFMQALDVATKLGKKDGGVDFITWQGMIEKIRTDARAEAREQYEHLEDIRSELGPGGKEPQSTLDKILEKVADNLTTIKPLQPQTNPHATSPQPQAQTMHQNGIPREAPYQPNTETEQPIQGTVMTTKDRVFQIIGPHLEGWIMGNLSHENAVKEAEKMFTAHGMTRQEILQGLSMEELQTTVRTLKIPQAAKNWIESFYARYQSQGNGETTGN